MKTKSEIIQRLLDEKKITVEEAMVLMEKDWAYVPVDTRPYTPYYPTTPYPSSPWWQPQYSITC